MQGHYGVIILAIGKVFINTFGKIELGFDEQDEC